jgi:threonine dehydratase
MSIHRENVMVFITWLSSMLRTGHSTVVDELVTQLPDKPSVIVAAVGDGGLLIGVLKGLERAGSFHTLINSKY